MASIFSSKVTVHNVSFLFVIIFQLPETPNKPSDLRVYTVVGSTLKEGNEQSEHSMTSYRK